MPLFSLESIFLNHIELFAGSGGLSLGLEKAGFRLIMANELSPMAAETFAYNFFDEDLTLDVKPEERKTLWLSSQYEDVSSRLRENPYQYPNLGEGHSDMPTSAIGLKDKLIVGNVIHLNEFLIKNPIHLSKLKSGFGEKEIDLVSGGPPCQSFSTAGLRKENCYKNTLPWEFANFVELTNPKIALLENVSGILRPFSENGKKYYAWFEVAKVFASKGYVPLCLHINARLSGVPQNRPRFIMLAIRQNIYRKIKPKLNKSEITLFAKSEKFLKDVKSGAEVNVSDLEYFDTSDLEGISLFKKTFLSPLVRHEDISVKDAIHDLRFNSKTKVVSPYVISLNKRFSKILKNRGGLRNHLLRNHSALVKRRFRLYQILQKISKPTSREVREILKGNTSSLRDEAWTELSSFKYLDEDNSLSHFDSAKELVNYIQQHRTKKTSQKSLVSSKPAPAALSIPDDGCHYCEKELRTLTVREMARIQSFPDDFIFRSKETTGSINRKFEVPQYTQVGNAVPPLLGLALGNVIKKILDKAL